MNHFFGNSQIYLVNAMFLAIKGKKSNRLSFAHMPWARDVFLIKKYGNNGKMGEIKKQDTETEGTEGKVSGSVKMELKSKENEQKMGLKD